MSTSTSSVTTPVPGGVVVGVDDSASSRAAICWAAHDAQIRNLPLTLVHVAGSATGRAQLRSREQRTIRIVAEAERLATGVTDQPVTGNVRYGKVAATLAELSENAAMVVVGHRVKSTVAEALTGSVSDQVARQARCPVAVVHDGRPLADECRGVSAADPVLVGIEGGQTSELAIEIAFEEASRRGVDLLALHAWGPMHRMGLHHLYDGPINWADFEEREEGVLDDLLVGWRDRHPDVTVHQKVVSDHAAVQLLAAARSAQLIVIGGHDGGEFSGALRTVVGRRMMRDLRTPLIVARTAGSQPRTGPIRAA